MKLLIKYLVILIIIFFIVFSFTGDYFNSRLKFIDIIKLDKLLPMVFVPFFEELIFRWGLKFSRISFLFMINCIFLVFLLFSINYFYDFNNTIWIKLVIGSLIICLITSLISFFIIKNNISKVKLFFEKNKKLIFWISISLFAVYHYANYSKYDLALRLVFLLWIFTSGYFLSKIRIEKGLIYSIALHYLILIITYIPLMTYDL